MTAAEYARRRLGAYLIVAAWTLVFFGFVWDIQFHADTGPDSFTTVPHGMIYGGSALGGIVCLAMVLLTTLRYHRQEPGVTDETTTPWLRWFRAPVGFLVGGLGVLSFVTAGGLDLYWHSTFGFDPILWTPPHILLFMSATVSTLGATYAFAALRSERPADRSVQVGLSLSLALTAAILGGTFGEALFAKTLTGSVATLPALYTLLTVGLLLTAAGVLRTPWAATLTGLVFSALRLGAFWFGPWANVKLSTWMGLPLKPDAVAAPLVAHSLPRLLLFSGILIDLTLWVARRYRLGGPVQAALAGIAGAVPVLLLDNSWLLWLDRSGFLSRYPEVKQSHLAQFATAAQPTLVFGFVAAAVVAIIGWGWGTRLQSVER